MPDGIISGRGTGAVTTEAYEPVNAAVPVRIGPDGVAKPADAIAGDHALDDSR